jgi:malate dehydrogenase (oxaloacetate-decarboxylating)
MHNINRSTVEDFILMFGNGGVSQIENQNQLNNVLVFPGIFRGALDCRAKAINDEMKAAAAEALAALVSDAELQPDHIIPSIFDRAVVPAIAAAVKQAAWMSGVAGTP